ncbi:MAG: DUF488 family protein, partial [Deltaproteobacteria bacterium]|nr:DUF488 family protein [Deltaproteobacteria bacterium]
MASRRVIYTIGHSDHRAEWFFGLLEMHGVEAVADVRSYPGSRRAPWSGQEKPAAARADRGLEYLYLGGRLGGVPAGESLYDEDGRVLYGKLARTPGFQQALDELACVAEMMSR